MRGQRQIRGQSRCTLSDTSGGTLVLVPELKALRARLPPSWGGDRLWQQRAACRGVDPGLFYAGGVSAGRRERESAAKALCARCPVLAPGQVLGGGVELAFSGRPPRPGLCQCSRGPSYRSINEAAAGSRSSQAGIFLNLTLSCLKETR